MCHEWAPIGWWSELQDADERIAASVRERGCPHCGGPLHRADYPRKPRGLPEEAEEAFGRRISFCCGAEGCRRRSTPPSLRFMGRRVYVAVVVVLAGAADVVHKVPSRTRRRWLTWWQTVFVVSALWQAARGFVRGAVAAHELPATLLDRFGGTGPVGVYALLRFLATAQLQVE